MKIWRLKVVVRYTDICEHTALRASKWSGFIQYVNEHQKIRHYRARSTEERRRRRRRKKKKNAKSPFFFYLVQCIRKIVLYSDVIHSFDWKSAIEHNGGV